MFFLFFSRANRFVYIANKRNKKIFDTKKKKKKNQQQ